MFLTLAARQLRRKILVARLAGHITYNDTDF